MTKAKVELFYFDGCPSWGIAVERLSRALSMLGRHEVAVERHEVKTPEQADELGFTGGSPTLEQLVEALR